MKLDFQRKPLILNVLKFLCVFNLTLIAARTAHLHDRPLTKERVEDSFNSAHYAGGEHQAGFDHEAVLGSKGKAHEYSELSPEESQRRLRILVTQKGMDANKDGFVDKEELISWVEDSFKSLAKEESIERLRDEDANKDGVVSWQEHMNDNFDLDEDEYDPEDVEMIKEDKALWAVADVNNDGQLDLEEFAAFNSPEDFERMHELLFNLSMEKRDKDQDGFLDFGEFIVDDSGSVPDAKSETYISEKVKFESDYDQDKDGKLNREEVHKWLIPDNRELAVSEAEHLIASSDTNDDGKLSVDEIVNSYEVFVGSESTDFGDRLHKLHDEL